MYRPVVQMWLQLGTSNDSPPSVVQSRYRLKYISHHLLSPGLHSYVLLLLPFSLRDQEAVFHAKKSEDKQGSGHICPKLKEVENVTYATKKSLVLVALSQHVSFLKEKYGFSTVIIVQINDDNILVLHSIRGIFPKRDQ